ncbi:DUF2147 domain-containing protein [Parasphingorhabdus litoris]|uniref:DUF2147 domain-containing protein n=2 Tax=Parasphingorhabdus litoris TaxID=394733 RepID=A0ABN0ZYT8_9SPHN
MKQSQIAKTIMLIGGLLMTTPALASGSINGNWVTQDGDAIVKIGKCGNTVCGRLHKYLVTPPNGVNQKDINNPDKKLRNRKLLGIAVLSGFKPDGKVWRGRIYDPKTGKSYRSEVSLRSPSKLKVKGCIAFFCQGQNWTRAK